MYLRRKIKIHEQDLKEIENRKEIKELEEKMKKEEKKKKKTATNRNSFLQ